MTPSYIRRVVGEGGAACRPSSECSGKQESADYSSKQNSWKRGRLSLFNPLYKYILTWAWENHTLC